jgi:hypothetical protein
MEYGQSVCYPRTTLPEHKVEFADNPPARRKWREYAAAKPFSEKIRGDVPKPFLEEAGRIVRN